MSGLYEYQTLQDGEIRLMELNCEGSATQLSGTIHHFYAGEIPDQPSWAQSRLPQPPPPYSALSHHWDPKPAPGTDLPVIMVHHKAEQSMRAIPLRPSLHAALLAIRDQMRTPTYWKNGYSRFFWIDAICIDQLSAVDKDKQLGRMGDIYNQAVVVLVWLGELDKAGITEKAFKFIRDLQTLRVLRLSSDPTTIHDYKEDWKSLGLLIRKPWFRRLWIVQEIAAARNAVFLAGNLSVSWDDFAGALSLFVTQFETIRSGLARAGFFGEERNPFGDIHLSSANMLVENKATLLTKQVNGDITEHCKTLEALLTSLSMFEVREPHDIIFAVIWLSNDVGQGNRRHTNCAATPNLDVSRNSNGSYTIEIDSATGSGQRNSLSVPDRSILGPPDTAASPVATRERRHSISTQFLELPATKMEQLQADRFTHHGNITISYDQHVYDICVQVMRQIIESTQRLDIICYHWAPPPREADREAKPPRPEAEPDHPTWLLHTQRSTYEAAEPLDAEGDGFITNVVRRINPDPLIGRPGNGPRLYAAAGRTRAENVTIEGRVLHAYGYVLGKLAEDGGVAGDAVVPAKWRRMFHWTCNKQPPPDRFWRTLVAEKGRNGQTPPEYFRLACQWAFGSVPVRSNLNLEKVRNDGKAEQPLIEFLDRAIATTWNRKLFKTEACPKRCHQTANNAFIGLGPEDARVGDVVCILWGCAVPVLLRPHVQAKPTAPPLPQNHGSAQQTKPKLTLNTGGEIMEDYTFVGECYVDGMMNGEIFRWSDTHDRLIQDFYIH